MTTTGIFLTALALAAAAALLLGHRQRARDREALIRELAANGQIATQYVGPDGLATYDIQYNPNGSMFAVEGITSPDGRVFGKMAHSERVGFNVELYKNVPGNYDNGMFRGAADYFK